MADSDTSTSLTPLTRRVLLAGASGAALLRLACASAAAGPAANTGDGDPAVSAWRDWLEASRTLERCCEAQQRFEADLLAATEGDPSKPSTEAAYRRALAAEQEAAGMEQLMAERLSATPAMTLAGVAAKLRAILRQGEWCENCPEFPWPQIRSALHDLVRIGRLDVNEGLPTPSGR